MPAGSRAPGGRGGRARWGRVGSGWMPSLASEGLQPPGWSGALTSGEPKHSPPGFPHPCHPPSYHSSGISRLHPSSPRLPAPLWCSPPGTTPRYPPPLPHHCSAQALASLLGCAGPQGGLQFPRRGSALWLLLVNRSLCHLVLTRRPPGPSWGCVQAPPLFFSGGSQVSVAFFWGGRLQGLP